MSMPTFYEKVLELLADLPPSYKISAVALVLLFFTFWRITANKKIIELINTSLNIKLQKHQLYKIIRLFLLLAALFCTLLIAFAFLAPAIQSIADARQIDIASKAFTALREEKDYPKARRLYNSALRSVDNDEIKAEEIKGMITATYYGQGLHREGLSYICDLYRSRSAGDTRYLFPIHAHLRAIKRRDGARLAEKTAKEFRENCDRPDFTEFWAYVPLGLMEELHYGTPKSNSGFDKIGSDDYEKLSEWLNKKQSASLSGTTPFGDYAAYFLNDYELILDKYPNSQIRDMALYEYARQVDGQERIIALKKFVTEFPKSELTPETYSKIVETYAGIGDRQQAVKYATVMKSFTGRGAMDLALSPTFEGVKNLIAIGDFKSALKSATSACETVEASGMACTYTEADAKAEAADSYSELNMETLPVEVQSGNSQVAIGKSDESIEVKSSPDSTEEQESLDEIQDNDSNEAPKQLARLKYYLNKILTTISNSKEGDCLPVYFDALEYGWLRGSRAYLDDCSKQKNYNDPEYAKSLYLLASVSRRLHEYDKSRDYLLLFILNVKDHNLLDDAYAELGFHYLIIEGNWELSKKYLEFSINNFPKRNAYDNALWWMARGYRESGDYLTALSLYMKISLLGMNSRFSELSSDEASSLELFSNYPPLKGVAFTQRNGNIDEGTFVKNIRTKAAIKSFDIIEGDRVHSLCGEQITTTDDMINSFKNSTSPLECELVLARDDYGIKISVQPDNPLLWKNERVNRPSTESDLGDNSNNLLKNEETLLEDKK